MQILWFLLIGLLAGVLAKALMPGGKGEPQGCLMTMALGVAGAMVGGFLIKLAFGILSYGLIAATLGAMLLIGLGRALSK
jgi:uncharacterized membrane protein YeaQ/YmgE (transglycosylase-associated protein family)